MRTAALLVPGEKAKCEPTAFAQTAEGFALLQQRLGASGLEPASILVVMEATGSYWMALATTLHQAGFAVSVINPVQALRPERWAPPPHIYYELQQRLAQRSSFLELRTQVSNQLHALSVSPVVVPAVRQRLELLIETVSQHIAQLDGELLALVRIAQKSTAEEQAEDEGEPADELELQWKSAIALLLTIPGIGLLTACWLVVATLNFTLCESPEAAVHYVGLAPMLGSSGTSVRSRAQIGHSGHARARTQLYIATLAAARFNPVIKTYYERLRAVGKPLKVGSTAALANCCISRMRWSNMSAPSTQTISLRPEEKQQWPKQLSSRRRPNVRFRP